MNAGETIRYACYKCNVMFLASSSGGYGPGESEETVKRISFYAVASALAAWCEQRLVDLYFAALVAALCVDWLFIAAPGGRILPACIAFNLLIWILVKLTAPNTRPD
jgi:hypothetical protein